MGKPRMSHDGLTHHNIVDADGVRAIVLDSLSDLEGQPEHRPADALRGLVGCLKTTEAAHGRRGQKTTEEDVGRSMAEKSERE